MATLAGIGVLVTRPESQAGALAHHLTRLGATVYRLPALEIVPRPPSDIAAQCERVGALSSFDWILFVSANAVRLGCGLLPAADCPRLGAVGPASAAALLHAGHPLALVPADGYDSEHLLASGELNSVSGQRILLVRGGEGRPLLADVLRQRGADVRMLDVYERKRATPAAGVIEAVEQAWRDGGIQVVTATSVDIVRALVEMLSPTGRRLLAKTPLLVGSARIAQALRQMDLQGPMVIATAPHDDGLIAALLATPLQTFQPNASA